MKTLYINNTDLTREKRHTSLSEDVVSTGSTIRVQSIIGFESLSTSSGQVVCIGRVGDEKTEIRRTSNTTGQSPSQAYQWIYLRDTLLFDHPQDTPVFIVDYDRAEVQWASSVAGAKTTIRAYPLNITPDMNETLYTDTTQTNGFYFTRFNETIGNTNSDWSDAIPYSGYDDNMVFSIKKRAVDELGEEIDGKVITHEFLNQSLWEARREYHDAVSKHGFRKRFNEVIGTALTGSYRIELPTDVESPYTAENIYGVRIGTNPNMNYYDKKEFDFDYINKPHATLDAPYTRDVSTSLWLSNGRDFAQSGSVMVENATIGYTKVVGSNNTLTVTSHGSYSASGGSDVWQNVSYGLPDKFTVWMNQGGSAYVFFNRPIETAYVNQNIFADYYSTLPGYDSDADVLDEPQYDMFVDYLKAKITHRRNRGQTDLTQDSNFKMWVFKKQNALAGEYVGAQIRIAPDISHLQLPT